MSVAAHDNCAFVLKRVANGDRVRFFQDFYGVHYAEVVPKWMFWRRARVRLDPSELSNLKSRLKGRRAS